MLPKIETPEISKSDRIRAIKSLKFYIKRFEQIYTKEETRKISITRLEIAGFDTTRFDKIEIKITNNTGIFLIEGPNFSGKTTTLELLLYSILGKAARKEFRSYIISKIKKTEIDLLIGSDQYKIRRNFDKRKHEVILPTSFSKNADEGLIDIFGIKDLDLLKKMLWNVFYVSQDEQKAIFNRKYPEGGYTEEKILSLLFQNPFSHIYFLLKDLIKRNENEFLSQKKGLDKKRHELEMNLRKIQLKEKEIDKISRDLLDVDIKLNELRKDKIEINNEIDGFIRKCNETNRQIESIQRLIDNIQMQIEVFEAAEISQEIFANLSPESCPICSRELTELMKGRVLEETPKCPLCNRKILENLNELIQNSITEHISYLNSQKRKLEEDQKAFDKSLDNYKDKLSNLEEKSEDLKTIEENYIDFLASLAMLKQNSKDEKKSETVDLSIIEAIETDIKTTIKSLNKLQKKIENINNTMKIVVKLENLYSKQIQKDIAKRTSQYLEIIYGKLESENMVTLNEFIPFMGDQSIKDLLPGSFRHIFTIAFLLAAHQSIIDWHGSILFPLMIDEPNRHLDPNTKKSFLQFLNDIEDKLEYQIILASQPDEGLNKVAKEIKTITRKLINLDRFLV